MLPSAAFLVAEMLRDKTKKRENQKRTVLEKTSS